MTLTIEIRDDHLMSYTDEHLANLWAAAQACSAPFGEREICQLVDRLGHEIIRRWLKSRAPSLWGYQTAHFLQRQIDKAAGEWRDGEWFPEYPAKAVTP